MRLDQLRLNELQEGEVLVCDKFAFVLCGPRTLNPLFFMTEPFILASECQLKRDIPDQYRAVICTAALVQRNLRPMVQKLNESDMKSNGLFKQLPMRYVGSDLRKCQDTSRC